VEVITGVRLPLAQISTNDEAIARSTYLAITSNKLSAKTNAFLARAEEVRTPLRACRALAHVTQCSA
jgi:hypothetical protein